MAMGENAPSEFQNISSCWLPRQKQKNEITKKIGPKCKEQKQNENKSVVTKSFIVMR